LWHNLFLDITFALEEACVEAIAIQRHPTEKRIEARKKFFRLAVHPGQAQARADMYRVNVGRARSIDERFRAHLPGQHAVKGCQTYTSPFIRIAAQFGLELVHPLDKLHEIATL